MNAERQIIVVTDTTEAFDDVIEALREVAEKHEHEVFWSDEYEGKE